MIILTGVFAGLSGYVPKAASAAVIYATGQNNGDPTHSTGAFFYSIDILTGKATPISAISGSPPAGPAVAPDGTLTGLDVTGDGRAFGIPFSGADRRLHQFDLTTNGTWNLVGTNPGLIFFGFGSAVAVPEPSSLMWLVGGLCCAARRLRSRRR